MVQAWVLHGPTPTPTVRRAKRALVSTLQLASFYNIDLDLVRESADNIILGAYRRVAKRARPDKGGDKTKFQTLQAAKEEWDSARQSGPGPQGGNPNLAAGKLVVSSTASSDAGFRVRSVAVLLTYCGKWSLGLWKSFVEWLRQRLVGWAKNKQGDTSVKFRYAVKKVLSKHALWQSPPLPPRRFLQGSRSSGVVVFPK